MGYFCALSCAASENSVLMYFGEHSLLLLGSLKASQELLA